MALFLYPLIGHFLQMSDAAFGVWSGVAVNDTSQVVATSAAYSVIARDVATVVITGAQRAHGAAGSCWIAWWWSRETDAQTGADAGQSWLKAIPPFVLMFLGMALLRSVGLIPVGLARWLDEGAKACILVAMAGIGLHTKLARHARGGRDPVLSRSGDCGSPGRVLSLLAILAFGMASAIRP